MYTLKKNLVLVAIIIAIVSIVTTSCEDEVIPLTVQFDFEKAINYAGDTVRFIDKTTGGKGAYEYLWNFGNETTSTEKSPEMVYTANGAYVVVLKVTDSKGNTSTAQKLLTIEPAQIKDVGNLELKWVGSTYLEGDVRSSTPAVSDDGFVYMTSNDHKLRKYNASTGVQVWAFDLTTTADGPAPDGNTHTTPTIDDDGTIYVGTGLTSGRVGRVYAINPNGTKKWVIAGDANTGFWNQGSASTPRIDYMMFPFDANFVYVGNRGGTGSLLAVNKTTGHRAGYVTSPTGTGGPAGGVTAGTILTKNKQLIWSGGTNGFFGASATNLSTVASSGTPYTWQIFNSTDASSVALNANGAMAVDAAGNIYAVATLSAEGGSVVSFSENGAKRWITPLGVVGDLDQGGVVIAVDGTIIATVKRSAGEANGGVVALNPANGSIKWKFQIPEDVSGTAAIDAAGRIHFGTQSGFYYIIDDKGSVEPIVKRDLGELIGKSGDNNWNAGAARVWSSPTIGDDGTVYIGVTNIDFASKSAIIALKNSGTTGKANSVWPMRGQNRRNTNIQP
jgi:outer membrane protein assembly factor BamB